MKHWKKRIKKLKKYWNEKCIITKKIIIAVFLLVIVTFLVWGSDDFFAGRNLKPDHLKYALIVTDRNDQKIYRTFDTENRQWVGY